MKTNKATRIISLFLIICSIAGLFPLTAQALKLEQGIFNTLAAAATVEFDMEYSQHMSIEVLIEKADGTREHFGWLIKDHWLDGYKGALEGHDPCASYTIPPPSDQTYSVGTAVFGTEVTIDPQPANPEKGFDNDYYLLSWTGTIDGYPAIERHPDGVKYSLVISFQGRGDLNKGITPCPDPDNGEHTRTDFLWPQQYQVETKVDIDYLTIIDDLLKEHYDITQYKDYDDMPGGIKDFIKKISNWVNFDRLVDIYDSNDETEVSVSAAEPVQMIDGSYIFSYTDLQLEGQFPLSFTRLYSSRGWDGSLGKGFTHSFDYKLTNNNGFFHVWLPGGEELVFLRLRPGSGADYYTVGNSEFTLHNTGSGGYIMRYKRGTEFEFNADGLLTEVRNEQGVAVYTLSYVGDELQSIDRVTGGSMSFTWSGGNISAATDSTGRSVRYGYDSDGRLVSVTNPDGDTLSYSYANDGTGYITTVKDFEGEQYLQNTYDAKGRVTKQIFTNADVDTVHTFSYDDTNLINTYTNPDGHVKKYCYDQYRNLLWTEEDGKRTQSGYSNYMASQLMDALGNETAFDIDKRGNVTKMTYADGQVITMEYDSNNLVTAVKYADGTFERFTYDLNKRMTSYRDRNGNETRYTYPSDANVNYPTATTDALGNTTTYTYANGSLAAVADAEGGEAHYTYDAVGRITALTVKLNASENAVTQYAYSTAGKLETVTDAMGNVTAYEYNANGFTTLTTDAMGGKTTTEYGTNGQPLSVTDANGNTTTYTYETGTARLKSVTDPEGNTSSYAYNEKDLLESITDAVGNTTTYEYDALDRLVKTTDALNGTTQYAYDSRGRTSSVTDAEGNTTSYEYDRDGRLHKTVNALSGETVYSYDPNGNVLSVTDANGNSTSTVYDAVNRATKTTDAMGFATSYTYDKVGRVKTLTNAEGGVTAYIYDLAGRTTSVTDANGNVTAYEYDLLGRTAKQTGADGSYTHFTYDALGRLTESFDQLNHKTSYTYDALGNTLSVTDPLSHVTNYTYNRNNRVITIGYADGGSVGYTYNALGQTAVYTDQNGNVTSYAYDALGRTSAVTDGEGYVTHYFYDKVGNSIRTTKDDTKNGVSGIMLGTSEYDKLYRLVTSTDGLGNSASYEYDKVGNVIVHTDKENHKTTYVYDDNYRLTSTTDAMSFTQSQTYDKIGRTTVSTDKEGNTTAYTYDPNGNTLTVTDALSGVLTYTYDNMNRVVTSTDKLGNKTTYVYDAKGQTTRITDPDGKYAQYTYDANGNVRRYTNRNNEYTDYTYDAMGRIKLEQSQISLSTGYEYDKAGNVVTLTDGNKHRTTYTYDGLNRVASETDTNGARAEYTYNYLGQIATLTLDGANGSRETTSYVYDAAGNLLTETSPMGFTTSYTYDKEGNIKTKTDENGVTTSYTYDDDYRLTERVDDDTTTFTYDKISNILTATNAVGTVAFAYDALYRTTQTTNEDKSTTSYSYDANGNRTSITYPDGNAVAYTYSATGYLTRMTDHDGSAIAYTRDAEGRATREDYSDGSNTVYTYDAVGEMLSLREVTAANVTRRSITYAYDDNGNLRSEQRTGVDIDKHDEAVSYTYDNGNRLVSMTSNGKTTKYTYDKAGNLTNDGSTTYTYGQQNRLLSKTGADGTTSYTYDTAGNLTKETTPDGTIDYTYNAQNRLTLGERSDGQSSAYVYNAMGARVENTQVRENKNAAYQSNDLIDGSHGTDYKDFLSDQRATWQRAWETEVGTTVQNNYETVTQRYIVDYLSLANRDIMVAEDGSWTQRYVYDQSGTRISAEYTHADGTARGVVNADGDYGENFQSDTAVDEVQKVWFRTSPLGSTLFAIDADGETVSHTIYDPWGKPLTETYIDANFSGLDNVNNYTGYTWDEVLRLYYAQARLYDAETHRFTQQDLVRDGNNWYVYCGDNPLTNTDPTGMFLKGTILIQGASGLDIIDMAYKLIAKGYLAKPSGSIARSYYTYGKSMVEAIKRFQEATDNLVVTGMVYRTTWEKLGLTVNSTIEQEFWSGKKGNNTINVTISGNNISINYNPKVYIEEEYTTQKKFTTRSGKDYYEDVVCIRAVSQETYDRYLKLITEGFKKWSTAANKTYTIQGVSATVFVNVNPTKVTSAWAADLYVTTTDDARSYVWTSAAWNTGLTPNMRLTLKSESEGSNADYKIMKVAMHEFGHVLGLFDAYKNDNITGRRADSSHAIDDDVMLADPTQKVYSYNIEMMLYAFKNNVLQNYANGTALGVPSEVYYRTGGMLTV